MCHTLNRAIASTVVTDVMSSVQLLGFEWPKEFLFHNYRQIAHGGLFGLILILLKFTEGVHFTEIYHFIHYFILFKYIMMSSQTFFRGVESGRNLDSGKTDFLNSQQLMKITSLNKSQGCVILYRLWSLILLFYVLSCIHVYTKALWYELVLPEAYCTGSYACT